MKRRQNGAVAFVLLLHLILGFVLYKHLPKNHIKVKLTGYPSQNIRILKSCQKF